MLSLIIVSLVAGVCLGQNIEYEECKTTQQLAEGCADKHLGYVKAQDIAVYNQMLTVGKLDVAPMIVDHLNVLCNDTMNLKSYYTCTFDKVAMCLKEANSTTVDKMPKSMSLASGVEGLCNARDDMNLTCIEMKMQNVQSCASEAMKTMVNDYEDPCHLSDIFVKCAEVLEQCEGGAAVKEFQVMTEPRMCSTDAASQYLPSLLLMLVALLFAHSAVAVQ